MSNSGTLSQNPGAIGHSDDNVFILLADFWDGFRVFEARHAGAETFIKEHVQKEMYNTLRAAVAKVDVLVVETLRDEIAKSIGPADYIVTLDGGILFPKHHFRIEVTRAADSIKNSVKGPYTRVARGFAPQLRQQVSNLSSAYRKFRNLSPNSEVILCDDGIGTGGTIRGIIELMKAKEIPINRIITVTNPHKLPELDGIPVETVYPTANKVIWLNERDLYWGLPRSGLSIYRQNQFVAIGGVPYSLSIDMVRSRVFLPESDLSESIIASFRERNLDLNKLFWQHLEGLHGRKLTLKECSRLQFFGDLLGNSDIPVIDLIEQARSGHLLTQLGFHD